MPPDAKTWDEYRMHVIETLEKQGRDFTEIFKRLGRIEIEIAGLKVRAGFFGFVAGMVPVLIMLAIIIIKDAMKQ